MSTVAIPRWNIIRQLRANTTRLEKSVDERSQDVTRKAGHARDRASRAEHAAEHLMREHDRWLSSVFHRPPP